MTESRTPDRIMAEYLLKGGKMLAKSCPVCYSPLFEYKGETFCVVCRESEANLKTDTIFSPVIVDSQKKSESLVPGELEDEFKKTLSSFLVQAREERDGNRVVQLMNAVRSGVEAYSLLYYGYGRRDKS